MFFLFRNSDTYLTMSDPEVDPANKIDDVERDLRNRRRADLQEPSNEGKNNTERKGRRKKVNIEKLTNEDGGSENNTPIEEFNMPALNTEHEQNENPSETIKLLTQLIQTMAVEIRHNHEEQRRANVVTTRAISQLQNDMVQYGRANTSSVIDETGESMGRRSNITMDNRDLIREREPNQDNRQSIRLIKEASRISSLKFDGNVVKTNPKKLTRTFEEHAILEVLSDREKLSAFISIMKGDAATWIELIEATTYREVKLEFLNRFWNKQIQKRIVIYILDGKYDKQKENNMESYFRKWASLAKNLDQTRDDEWIIDNLKTHFPEWIQDKFDNKEPQTIAEATEILMKLDKPNFGINNHEKKGDAKQWDNRRGPTTYHKNETNQNKNTTNYRPTGPRHNNWNKKSYDNARNNVNPRVRTMEEEIESESDSDNEDLWEENMYEPDDDTKTEEIDETLEQEKSISVIMQDWTDEDEKEIEEFEKKKRHLSYNKNKSIRQ